MQWQTPLTPISQTSLSPNANTPNETIQTLQAALLKSNIQISKLESTISSLQSKLSSFTFITNNNSSTSFLLTSEFKKEWLSLGSFHIMECFEHVFNRSVLLCQMVQEAFLLSYREAQLIIDKKVSSIKKIFNITDSICSKVNFYSKLKPYFIEFFTYIFEGDILYQNNTYVNSIISKLEISISKLELNKYFNSEISSDLNSENLRVFIKKALRLSFYMILHEPKLDVYIPPYETRELQYYYYNKLNFINIEGFERDNAPCLVILPPPMIKENFPFQGLKPFVYIIADPDEKIFENCEKHKVTSDLRYSKSFDFFVSNEEPEEDEDKINSNNIKENKWNYNSNNNSNSDSDSNVICKGMINSKSSKLKKRKMCIMGINEGEIEQKNIDSKKNENKIMNDYNTSNNSNISINSMNSNSDSKKYKINQYQRKWASRNILLKNLNPTRHFESHSTIHHQKNFSIEKEINLGVIFNTIDQTKNKKYQNSNIISNNYFQNSPQCVKLFNSEQSQKNKTKPLINQRQKIHNNNNNNCVTTYDNCHLGLNRQKNFKGVLISNNSTISNIKDHKKIEESLLGENYGTVGNCNDNINIANKRVEKTICFTNDLLKFRNNSNRSNKSTAVNGNGKVLGGKKKINNYVFKNGNNCDIATGGYRNKKLAKKF